MGRIDRLIDRLEGHSLEEYLEGYREGLAEMFEEELGAIAQGFSTMEAGEQEDFCIASLRARDFGLITQAEANIIVKVIQNWTTETLPRRTAVVGFFGKEVAPILEECEADKSEDYLKDCA